MRILFVLLLLTLNASAQAVLSGNSSIRGNAALAFTAAAGGGGLGTVTFDAASALAVTNGTVATKTLTYSHTVGAGLQNSYLTVWVANGFPLTPGNVTNVTYGGVAMTLITNRVVGASGHGECYLFGLTNPAAGAANVIITLAISLDEVAEVLVSGAISWQGVSQATPYDNVITGNGDSTAPTLTVTSESNDAVVVATNGGSDYTAWPATDRGHNNYSTGSGGGCAACTSDAGAASVANTWTMGSDSWATVGCNLNHD